MTQVGPEIVAPVGFFTMVVIIVVGLPLARAYAKRMERAPHTPPQIPQSAELISRLDRIEQAIEVMATEVERITEGQRFVTKLLSETRQQAVIASGTPPGQPAAQVPPAIQQPAQQPALPSAASDSPSNPPSDPDSGTILTPSARRP